MSDDTSLFDALPDWVWRTLRPHLLEGETPLCWFEPDLDAQLNFAQGLLVLTDRRLLSFAPLAPGVDAGAATIAERGCQIWAIETRQTLRCKEHAGVGRLELSDAASRPAVWRYTAARSAAAHRVASQFQAAQRGETEEVEAIPAPLGGECPICAAPTVPDAAQCPACGASLGKPALMSLLRLRRFIHGRIGMVVLGVLLSMAGTGASLIAPYLTIPIIDDILTPYLEKQPAPLWMLKWYLLGLAGAAVLAWLLSWGRTYVLAWVSERVAAEMRNQTYAHLQKLSLEYFGGKRTGDLIARVSTDTDRICYFLSVYLLDFGNDLLMIAMTAGIMVWINARLAAAALLPLPVIAFLVHRARNRLRRGFSQGNRAWSEMTSVLADTIPGIRVVKAFAQERREIDRFRAANDRVLHANDRVNRLWSFFGPAVTLLTDAGVLIVWLYAVWLAIHYSITIGVLTAFLTYISRFYARLDSMSRMFSATQRAGASVQRIFAILDRVPSVGEPARPVPLEKPRGEIEFRNVGFRYGSRTVLENVNLAIRPGEMIGLVGPSGAGKTTLINLVCRFYDVAEGAILLDGVDIRNFAMADYRKHIGIVLQEPFLFYGTIAENIAYGRPQADRASIVAAARAARAHEFILRLPDGYDSLVGERGQFLSGGERQRISIARALLIDPRILILDEATSSVDTETEREIQLALENLVQGRTTIAIAHRLSTLQRADRLVVIEHGRITEMGPHRELVGQNGTYARLYQAQVEMNQRQPA